MHVPLFSLFSHSRPRLLLALAAGVCLAGSAQAQALVTARAAIPAPDPVDWAVLGDDAYPLGDPFHIGSAMGVSVSVAETGHGLSDQSGGVFGTIRQAGSPMGEGTLNGNFAPGDIALYALDGGTVSLTFPRGVYGGGAQVAVPAPTASGAGAFTVQVQAFGRDGAPLASWTRGGTFSARGDNSAPFLGIVDAAPDIYRISYTGVSPHYGLFLNRFDIATAPAAPAAGHTHLLWTSANGAAALWTVNADGSFTSTRAYGPIPGWTATTIADGPDGKTRLLWTRADGMSAVWTVNDADGSFTSTPGYGPFTSAALPSVVISGGGRWDAVSLAVGPDDLTRLEWKHSPDGRSVVWIINPNASFASTPGYGPYGPWTASSLAAGGDDLSRLLWGDGAGRFSVWAVAADGSFASTPAFGPYPGWSATAIAGGPDADARLLLNRSDGAMSVWTVGTGGTFTSTPLYGPIPGWTCHGLAVGPDALSRVLWSRSDGMSSVWTIAPSGGILSTPGYGPYSGWSAVALSAGP